MDHTRMSFFIELGFDCKVMVENKIDPVVFYEHMYYFREVFLGNPIKVSAVVMGMS
jgi:acyl-CoA thioester hydrolase